MSAAKESAVQFMISRDINAPLKAAPPSPDEARAYFDSHREVFALHELRRATEIVVATEAQARALVPQLRAADSNELRELVLARGLDVPSKANGGDLHPFDITGRPESGDVPVDPKLANAVFALATVGDVSDVIAVDGGHFAILKLTEIRPGHTPSFDEMRVRVRRRIEDERYEQAIQAIAHAQREQLHPRVRYELVDGVQLE
jgi:hypothetical protein